MVVCTQIRSMTSVLTLEEQASDLRDDLEAHPTVTGTSIDTDRRPHRVRMRLAAEAAEVPEGVQDILEQHAATIEQVEALDGNPLFHLRPAEAWKPAGQRTIRAHGGSIVVTLTREALELSGLAEDDVVDLEARQEQVRIARREA